MFEIHGVSHVYGPWSYMLPLGVCPSNAFLLRQTIREHLRRSRLKNFLNVFQRIRLRIFRACGLASASSSFCLATKDYSDRLLAEQYEEMGGFTAPFTVLRLLTPLKMAYDAA
ncbi:MAG: hypothetical protein NTNFB02_34380 [Nitrospira sp.]